MKTCKDCIHEKVCDDLIAHGLPWKDGKYPADEFCDRFKNKADFVEVVRCKDCCHYIEMKGFDYNGRKSRSCVWHSALRGENDYCSDAIRKTRTQKGGEG